MNYSEFVENAKRILNKDLPLHTKGSILYTTFNTVQRGDYYIIGLNPGGNPGGPNDRYPLYENMTLAKSLDACEDPKYNEYKKNWREPEDGPLRLMPLQKNINHIAENFLGKQSDEICCTNLIYKTTQKDIDLSNEFLDVANLCWKVHKLLLDVIEPKLIIAFGNQDKLSPFSYIHKIAGNPKTKEEHAFHWKYRIKYFTGDIEGRKTHVLGLPHLSRYTVYKDEHETELTGMRKDRNDVISKVLREMGIKTNINNTLTN